jgi:segregation and condensation protein A
VIKIKIQQFEGPLDLLLKLIEDQELDITEISLAHVTEQFLQYMRSLADLRPQELADWLVVAAKLLVIKSKALMPMLSLPEEDEEEAADLAWQLYQYKKYKESAKALDQLQKKGLQGFSRGMSFLQKIVFFPDPAVNPATLRDTMLHLAKNLEVFQEVPRKVLEEVVTISEKIDQLQKLLSEKIQMKLKDLLENSKSKTEIIVTFLALLELVKQRLLTVDQEAIFSDIVIKRR